MGLATDTTDRLSTKRLVALSNPEVGTATTVNTTLLAKAVSDVEAEFQLVGGALYDSDNAIHVAVGVSGVVAKLFEWTGNGGEWAMAHREIYERRLGLLRTREAYVPATTSSNLSITRETSGSVPRTDAAAFRGYSAGPSLDDGDELSGVPGVGL